MIPIPAADEAAAAHLATRNWYDRIFATQELAETRALQWLFGAALVGYLLTFLEWAKTRGVTVQGVARNQHTCWPHFTSCGDLAVMHALPWGHSQAAFYTVIFAMLVGGVLAAAAGRWRLAHALMLVPFVWKSLVLFVLSQGYLGNYHYFHVGLGFLLLFSHHKLWFLRRGLVLLYVLSSVVKLHEGWVLGTYFSALVTGLPFVPDALIPLATNGVIAMEMLVAPLLLSERPRVRGAAVVALLGFHLYSMLFVNFMYPTICVPPLLILFGARHRSAPRPPPLGWRVVPGFAAFVAFIVFQAVPIAIRGDEKLTLEGHGFGLYMFEANHQCVSSVKLFKGTAVVADLSSISDGAHNRCGPYDTWFTVQRICKENRGKIDRIEWKLDHSINGGAFWRIVDEPDACALDYAPFRHNDWIRLPGEGAVPVAYPVKNFYL